MPQIQDPKNPSRHVTTAKSQVTVKISPVNSEEKKIKVKETKIVLRIKLLETTVLKQTIGLKMTLVVRITTQTTAMT